MQEEFESYLASVKGKSIEEKERLLFKQLSSILSLTNTMCRTVGLDSKLVVNDELKSDIATFSSTLEDLTDSTNYALSKFGYPQRSLSEVKSFVGNGVRLLMERAIPSGSFNSDFEDCLQTFKSHYKQNMYNKTKPYKHILEMLKTLKLLIAHLKEIS